ncbi:MAG: hypothetical protein ABH834_04985 [Candidatus Altiarchaeota archaeon]
MSKVRTMRAFPLGHENKYAEIFGERDAVHDLVKNMGTFVVTGPCELPLSVSGEAVNFQTYDFVFNGRSGTRDWERVYQVAVLGDIKDRGDVLARIDSHCSWGQVWGSRYCDCGWQLANAKKQVATEGSGIIIHGVSQEGANMGYGGHLQLYLAYQMLGMDRAEAGKRVSGDVDPRSFGDAAQILRYLGVKGVKLITNNPQKIADLQEGGLKVTRVPSIIPKEERSDRVSALIAEKKASMGHMY